MRLAEYLAQAARTPFAWGRHDCLLWLADWAVANGHPDGGARWRGHYRTALGCQRLLRRHGGLVEVARISAEACGLPAIAPGDMRPGDVGVGVVAVTEWGEHATGLIRTGLGWAVLGGPAGILVGQATPQAAWRV